MGCTQYTRAGWRSLQWCTRDYDPSVHTTPASRVDASYNNTIPNVHAIPITICQSTPTETINICQPLRAGSERLRSTSTPAKLDVGEPRSSEEIMLAMYPHAQRAARPTTPSRHAGKVYTARTCVSLFYPGEGEHSQRAGATEFISQHLPLLLFISPLKRPASANVASEACPSPPPPPPPLVTPSSRSPLFIFTPPPPPTPILVDSCMGPPLASDGRAGSPEVRSIIPPDACRAQNFAVPLKLNRWP